MVNINPHKTETSDRVVLSHPTYRGATLVPELIGPQIQDIENMVTILVYFANYRPFFICDLIRFMLFVLKISYLITLLK